MSSQTLQNVLASPEPTHFTAHFLERVPFTSVRSSMADLHDRFGRPQGAQPTSDPHIWAIQAERGEYAVYAQFDEAGQLSALRIPVRETGTLKSQVIWLVLLVLHVLLVRAAVVAWTQPTLLSWLTDLVPGLVFGATLLAVAVWSLISTWLRPVLWLALLSLGLSTLRAVQLPLGDWSAWDVAFSVLLLAVLLPLLLQGWRGHRAPRGAVPLGPVLSGGTFMVAQGGSTPAINYHMAHPVMRYAVDLIGVGALGRPMKGWFPAPPSEYAIFGAEVLAPLSGRVVALQEGLPDLSVPRTDALRPAGNHVVIRSTLADGRVVNVILAHLKQGSVRVSLGADVRQGEVIGQVGNSGNTTEPHLHLGVNEHAEDGDPFGGEGVAFTIDGRYPGRGRLY